MRLALIAASWFAVAASAAVPDNHDPAATIVEEIERLFVDLDSNEFSVRNLAFKQLQELSAHEASRPLLAESVEQAMVDAEISFEVRRQLERLHHDLPPAELLPSPEVEADSIDQLLARLADDSYARRLGAENRLRWLLGGTHAAELIFERVKHTAATDRLTHEQTRSLQRIYLDARATWLNDAARLDDAEAPAEQIGHLVEQLAGSELEHRFPLTDEPIAVVELRDLLASDANVAPIRKALQARLDAGDVSSEAAQRLSEMLELTKPAMVAEYWNNGRHRSIQPLLVGVPSVTASAGTSHFDRIDDQTAHCVTGVNLSEGDYPVGVAFPHPLPHERNSFFHLVNLPTPRRRMAYEYQVKEDESARYAALVAHTLDRYLSQQLPISERELAMIMQFDPREVSRFAGRYLATVDDRPVVIQRTLIVTPSTPIPGVGPSEDGLLSPPSNSEGGPSIHGLLCSWLASAGTQEAVPGLLTAIEEDRLLAPCKTRPDRYDRFAALAIAQRDPWPDVDRWLAEMLTREECMIFGQADGPELGATAASILLQRHGGSPDDFDLVATNDVLVRPLGLRAYRNGVSKAAHKVADWWQKRQQETDAQDTLVEPYQENGE